MMLGRRINKKLWPFLFWLMVWGIGTKWIGLPFLLPGPAAVFSKLTELWGKASFWLSLAGSFARVSIGFVSAISLGTLLAVCCARFPALDTLLSPLRSLIRSTPISSFIILVLLWLSISITPVFISFLAVMPLIWQDVQQGIAETSGELLEMAKNYRFSSQKTLRYVYIPSVLPYFYTACANGIGLAWKACIAAEVIARPMHSVGKNLQDAKIYLLTEELFAWTITVVILSMALEAGIKKGMARRASESRAAEEKS